MIDGERRDEDGHARILVVDDDARNRRLLEAMLTPAGYEVVEADSGHVALEIVRRRPPDLVLLDVMMPGIDGIETCRRIRHELEQKLLPIVFVTALGERESRIRGKAAGADDFLIKPIDDTELLVRVKNLLDAKAYLDQRERHRELLERELERRSAMLLHAERLASLGTLAGGVGHELNNLTAVFVSTLHFTKENAARGLPPDPEDLAQLERVADHLKLQAQNLLSLGRPGPSHAERVDVRDVVRATVAMLRAVGRTKHVAVEIELPDRPVEVTVNRARIEQVLVNLILNAADAMAEARSRSPRVVVGVRPADARGRVTCWVEDNGPGIAADRLEAIFEPYVTTKPPDRGTGLGLPVVKQIVESYGGRITVKSVVGAGATFSFDLPDAAAREALPS